MKITESEKLKLHKKLDKSLEKYFCEKCKTFHKKFYKNKLSNIFFLHLSNKSNLSQTQIWKEQFKKAWKKYNLQQHAKIYKKGVKYNREFFKEVKENNANESCNVS